MMAGILKCLGLNEKMSNSWPKKSKCIAVVLVPPTSVTRV